MKEENKEKNKEKNKKNKKPNPKIEKFLLSIFRVPLKEKLFFARNINVMIKAGISLVVSLRTIAAQSEHKRFATILLKVADEVESGHSLAESLKGYDKIFDELFINMIEAGEISGKLEEVLDQLYLQMKKQYELNSRIKGAMTYPAVIVFAMSGIGVFVMTSVVPKLADVFTEFQATLPLPTRIIIAVSNLIVNHGVLVAIGLAAFILAFLRILKTQKGKYIFHGLLLRMPVFSPIIKKINLARFSRTTGSLLKTDIMIIKTFQITSSILGNTHYRRAVLDISERIKKGGQVNEVLNNYPHLFPPLVRQMIAIGEQTGELDSILGELADFYEDEVNKIMETLPSLIEPLLILVLGAGIGLMAVAVIMPMYTLTGSM